ncbi:hypothetical protein ACFQXA_36215 [Nocardiopsis composta]
MTPPNTRLGPSEARTRARTCGVRAIHPNPASSSRGPGRRAPAPSRRSCSGRRSRPTSAADIRCPAAFAAKGSAADAANSHPPSAGPSSAAAWLRASPRAAAVVTSSGRTTWRSAARSA